MRTTGATSQMARAVLLASAILLFGASSGHPIGDATGLDEYAPGWLPKCPGLKLTGASLAGGKASYEFQGRASSTSRRRRRSTRTAATRRSTSAWPTSGATLDGVANPLPSSAHPHLNCTRKAFLSTVTHATPAAYAATSDRPFLRPEPTTRGPSPLAHRADGPWSDPWPSPAGRPLSNPG